MTGLLSPAVYRRLVAFELQRMRKAAGITQQGAADKLGCSRVRINHFESMRNIPRAADVEVLLPFYSEAERVEEFREIIAKLKEVPSGSDLSQLAEVPKGFDLYLGLEQGARSIRSYDAMTVLGLLQCEQYAAALLQGHASDLDEQEVAQRLQLRMLRQSVLEREEAPLDLAVILDESVVHRNIGGSEVMRAQLGHLLTVSERPNISIRVLPANAGVHPALHGPFTLMDFLIEGDPGLVYIEDRLGGRWHEDADDIDEYIAVMNRLRAQALDEQESAELLTRAREEFK